MTVAASHHIGITGDYAKNVRLYDATGGALLRFLMGGVRGMRPVA